MAPTLALAAALLLPAMTAAVPVNVNEVPVPVNRGLPARDEFGSLIVGGVEAATGEFPFIVSLSSGGSHFCGGVLLNANTVITAGHCSTSSPSSVKVRAGSNNRSSGGTQVGVSQIKVHPSYNANTLDQDIALWKLATPIATGTGIAYVTLPASGSDPAAGQSLTVAGWGTTSSGGSSLPATLRKVAVPAVSRASCSKSYQASYTITTNMFCAAEAAGGKDSCQGDSGGPIVDTSSKVLQGLVSWGIGCAQAAYPGVYTRVGNYVSWINSNKW